MDVDIKYFYGLLENKLRSQNSIEQKESRRGYDKLEIVKSTQEEKILLEVNELSILEREIIRILLLYGNEEVDFTEEIISTDEDGKQIITTKKYRNTVSSEIYLHLQDDEIEFTNSVFQEIYTEVIHQLNQSEKLELEKLVNHNNKNIAQTVTSILMDEEKHQLSNWEKKNIFVTSALEVLKKAVNDSIFNLRRVLIGEKINELLKEVKEESEKEIDLEMIKDYTNLRMRLFTKLNRVV